MEELLKRVTTLEEFLQAAERNKLIAVVNRNEDSHCYNMWGVVVDISAGKLYLDQTASPMSVLWRKDRRGAGSWFPQMRRAAEKMLQEDSGIEVYILNFEAFTEAQNKL